VSGSPAANLVFEDLVIDAMTYYSLELIRAAEILRQRLGAILLQLPDFRADFEAMRIVALTLTFPMPRCRCVASLAARRQQNSRIADGFSSHHSDRIS